eukprot:540747-Karenia_brevis.AAC.1
MEVGNITGAELQNLLAKCASQSACGMDGWRMAELRMLPVALLDGLAQIFNCIEKGGKWPKTLSTAL